MVTEAPVEMVALHCRKCNKKLMMVLREHLEMVKARIQIKCYRCGDVQ